MGGPFAKSVVRGRRPSRHPYGLETRRLVRPEAVEDEHGLPAGAVQGAVGTSVQACQLGVGRALQGGEPKGTVDSRSGGDVLNGDDEPAANEGNGHLVGSFGSGSTPRRRLATRSGFPVLVLASRSDLDTLTRRVVVQPCFASPLRDRAGVPAARWVLSI